MNLIEVTWPSGTKQRFANVAANQFITIDEARGILKVTDSETEIGFEECQVAVFSCRVQGTVSEVMGKTFYARSDAIRIHARSDFEFGKERARSIRPFCHSGVKVNVRTSEPDTGRHYAQILAMPRLAERCSGGPDDVIEASAVTCPNHRTAE